jgi:hypothetical protein
MARSAAVVAALAISSVVLTGCGGGGGGTSLFGSGSSPLDLFNSSTKATSGGTANSGPLIDTQFDCPEVKIRYGASTLTVGGKPGEAEPNPLEVRYQGSITRTARECHLAGTTMIMKVGIEGRIITGPAGGPGAVEVPLRIAVVHEGVNPQTIVSKFARETATVTQGIDRASFVHIDSDISFPLPAPAAAITNYVVYVGFDPLGAKPQVKKPVPKRHKKRPANPRSS